MLTAAELTSAGIAPRAAEIVLEWAELVHAARAALILITPAGLTARRIYRAALATLPAWERPADKAARRADLLTLAELVRERGAAAAEDATAAALAD